MTACYEDEQRRGQRIATTKEEGLAWFERLFSLVAQSDWLTGKSGVWAADLGWLVGAANFEKVVSGRYQNQGATR
jgi:hypothetical protein